MASNDEQINISFLIDTSEADNSLKGTKANIKSLQDAMLKVGEGPGVDKLAAQVGKLKERLRDATEATNAFRGTGIEKLQASMGLLKDSFTSFNPDKMKVGFQVLGAAMKAIPIFLIIEGIKYLIENFEKLTNSSGIIGKVFRAVGDVIGWLVDKFYELTDAIGLTNHAEEELAKTQLENAKASGERQQQVYDDQIKLLKAAGKETYEAEQKKQQAIILSAGVQMKALNALRELNGSLTKEQQKQLEDLYKAVNTASIESKALQLGHEKELNDKKAEQNKEYLAKKKEAQDKFNKDQKALSDKALADQVKNDAEELKNTDTLIKNKQKLADDAQLRDAQSDEARIAIKAQRAKDEIDLEYEKSNRSVAAYQAMIDAKKLIDDQAGIDTDKGRSDWEDKNIAEGNADIKRDEDNRKKKNDGRKADAEKALAMAKATEQAMQGISDLYFMMKRKQSQKGSAQDIALAKKQFKVNKALAIASALISGAVAAVNALSAAPFFPMAIIGLAMATITTVLSVAKIASTKFEPEGGGGGGSPMAAPSPGEGASAAPSFSPQTFGVNSGASGQTPGSVLSSTGGVNAQPQKVIMVETDVTRTVKKVQTIESRAAY